MGNKRNSRTTFPRQRARRQAALDRFQINEARAAKDKKYAAAKSIELASLKRQLGV